ncbi:GSCFA domain-containing protein, partial [Psychrobacter sp. GW64-MNA-CIBAN-0177]
KELNPKLNIILTVSPVPLTATATDKHILVASYYSKAVLRAVAGYLSDYFEDISYFPSFEIISVNSSNDFRFENNRRTVSPKGVDYVMKHFKS